MTDVQPWREDRPDALVLHAPTEHWIKFFRAAPGRWHYDVLGMERRVTGFRVARNRDVLIRNLRALHRLFELARRNQPYRWLNWNP